eukprot:1366215-Rhodomonas_salina.1
MPRAPGQVQARLVAAYRMSVPNSAHRMRRTIGVRNTPTVRVVWLVSFPFQVRQKRARPSGHHVTILPSILPWVVTDTPKLKCLVYGHIAGSTRVPRR